MNSQCEVVQADGVSVALMKDAASSADHSYPSYGCKARAYPGFLQSVKVTGHLGMPVQARCG